jgi:hypothetical protein
MQGGKGIAQSQEGNNTNIAVDIKGKYKLLQKVVTWGYFLEGTFP